MPEQITQKLGFDASAAITSLTNLNQKLGEFRQGLQATSGGLRKFEKNAQTAIVTFRELGRAATSAAAAVAQLRTSAGGAVPPQVAAQAAAASAAMGTLGTSATATQGRLSGVTTSVGATTAAMGGLAAATTAAATSAQSSSARVATAANRTTAALQRTGQAGQQAATSIGISWKTIGRIILAQAVIRGLSLLISTFNDAQEAAREFSLRVGEISTIAGGALGSINEISDATLELSRSLGIATDEVAEGLYQTLSNQVVEAGDAMRFETTAAKLSITTHSQLKESINALSSVMNSYQLDVSEAEEVSAVLFKTVELGRLRMGEFGDVLGRVSPLTAALGIEYKEMAAALAAITQKGVPAHTAITQLTAVTQKLLRPTAKLQELYNEWGVETGPEAIRRFGGLRGVLLKMRDATAGNDKEFADLLGRVRSMVGAMNLTTNEADALTHALGEMKDPTDDLDAAFGRMESTIGRRSVKAWDDLDVTLHKAGKTFLEATTPMVEVLASIARNSDYVLAAMVGMGAGAILVTGKLAIAGAAVLGFNVKLLTLRATMMTILPVALAIAAAIAVIEIKKAFIKSVDTASAAFNRLQEHQEKLTKTTEAESKKRIEATRQEVRERDALVGGFIANEEKLLRRGAQLFAIESKAIGDVLSDTLTDLENKRVKALKVVTDAVTGMDDAIKDSQQIIKETQEAISKFDFERSSKHLSEQQKLWAGIARTEKKATEAANAYKDALASEEDTIGARRLSKIAEAQARQNLADAERQGNVATIARAEKNVSKILADRNRGEQTFINERRALDTADNRLAVKRNAEAHVRLKELLKERAKLIKPTKADDVTAKDPKEFAADKQRAKDLEGAIAEALEQATNFDFAKSLKIEGLGTRLATEMELAVQDANFQWDNAVKSLDKQLRAQTYTVNVVTNLAGTDLLAATEEAFGPTAATEAAAFERIKQTSEKAVAAEAEALAQLKGATREAKSNLLSVNELLTVGTWVTAGDEAARIADKLQEWDFTPDLKGFREVSSETHFKMSAVADTFADATRESRALTDQERKRVNDLFAYIKQQKEAGNLTGNRLKLATQATHQFKAQNDELNKIVQAEKDLKALGDQPEQGRAFLGSLEATVNKEKDLKKEVDGVTDGVKAAKEASDKIPASANAGTEAISREADEAGRLKTNLQGAATAQQNLSQTKAQVQPTTVPALKLPELPAAPVQKVSDGVKDAAEAVKPLIQGIENATEAAEGVPSFGIKILNGVSQATSATRTLGAQTIDVAGKFATTAGAANSVSVSVEKSAAHIDAADTSTDAWATGMDSVAIAAQKVTLEMQAAARASTEAAIAAAAVSTAGSNIGTAFHGGPAVNYRAAGGPASRGKDTIPVMAAPDEFFMNARSSRRFSTELQAMNAGREPIFRDKGGSVTNVGDINVSVTQGETASQTARQIANSLRRELRRGTSRL